MIKEIEINRSSCHCPSSTQCSKPQHETEADDDDDDDDDDCVSVTSSISASTCGFLCDESEEETEEDLDNDYFFDWVAWKKDAKAVVVSDDDDDGFDANEVLAKLDEWEAMNDDGQRDEGPCLEDSKRNSSSNNEEEETTSSSSLEKVFDWKRWRKEGNQCTTTSSSTPKPKAKRSKRLYAGRSSHRNS